ncbi:MAG TPA: class I SAM-dependent methyltransferase [Anaerolineaceae bacterium]
MNETRGSKCLYLKPGREKSVLHRHPWIFSGAVARVDDGSQPGETMLVCSANGERLGWAAYSPASQIRARIWAWDADRPVDREFFRDRVRSSLGLRRLAVPGDESDAVRLVFAESDGMPGLIADRYANWIVVQSLTAGADARVEDFADLLVEETGIKNIYERSDADVRELEGLPPRMGVLRGDTPPERISIRENGLNFLVDIRRGHKTGFYIDQRPNRLRLRSFAPGKQVLNCFSYTGGFAVSALAGGAESVLSIDTSAAVLELGRQNLAANGLDPARAEWVEGDVFHLLREYRDRGRTFDLIVLDPPKFAPTAAQADKAARGYKDINLLAIKLLRPGGVLFTFSCSGGVSLDLFQKIVAGAALDAGAHLEILETMTQGPDHPVALNFPEGAYLKGLICAKA